MACSEVHQGGTGGFLRAGLAPKVRIPWIERRRSRDERERVVLLRIPNYFEEVAVVARLGGVDWNLFVENYAGIAADYWVRWEPTIREFQKADPGTCVEFDRLAALSKPGERPGFVTSESS